MTVFRFNHKWSTAPLGQTVWLLGALSWSQQRSVEEAPGVGPLILMQPGKGKGGEGPWGVSGG